jgi:competence protein ComEC
MNALGTSLIITLLFNPLNFTNIGFQLSFLCSFAILLIYPLIEGFSTKLIKKRSLLEKKDLNAISKIAEKLINYLRQCFCLTLSINILILPVVLYHFHKFALISFLYNLFIPFLIGICMILTIIGLIFYFLTPPIGAIVNFINTFFTKYLLKLITYPPTCLQFYIRYKNFSYEAVLIYLIIITLIFLFLRWYLKKGHIPEYIHFL